MTHDDNPHGVDGGPRAIATLERELAAKQRTIDVLMDMVERGSTAALGSAFAAFSPAASGASPHEPNTRRLRQALAEIRARHKSLADRSEQLEAAAAFQRSVVDAVEANICILDAAGVIVATNAQWRRFAADNGGDEARTGPGVSYLEVCRQDESPSRAKALETAAFIDAVAAGADATHSLEYPCPGEIPRWFQVRVSPLRGTPLGRVVVAHFDITERRMAEARLAQAERLESIGQLAAGIAHEINTPMQYIGDNLLFLDKAFARLTEASAEATPPPGAAAAAQRLVAVRDRVPRALQQAREGVEAVSKIVRAMKNFTRGSEAGEMTLADINAALENTLIVSRNEWKYSAELVTEFDPALPRIEADIGALSQVFLNLLVNAGHAIADRVGEDERGVITVRTRRDAATAEVVIEIEDSGTGIRPEIIDRIFDPFFTTKAVGRGTGQGLAIARLIVVKRHGGTLTVRSRVGEGSCFVVRLPVHARTGKER